MFPRVLHKCMIIFSFYFISVLSQKNREMQGKHHHILDMYGRFNVQGHFGVNNNNYLHPYNEIKAHSSSR